MRRPGDCVVCLTISREERRDLTRLAVSRKITMAALFRLAMNAWLHGHGAQVSALELRLQVGRPPRLR